MMTNTEAMQAILALIGRFDGMPKQHIQLINQPLLNGKPFTAPNNAIWARVNLGGGARFITGIGDKPCTRTTSILFVQLSAPINSGVVDVSKLADRWAEHLQFYSFEHLQMGVSIITLPNIVGDFYQVNINTKYTIN